MRTVTTIFILALFSTLTFAQSTQLKQSGDSKPFVLGVIEEIQSTQIGEKRILNIYLPEGYNPDDTIKYAVIYLLDGSADEDFIHIAGLVQFNNFPWINRVPKSIVVGIANVDRQRDFTCPTSLEADKKRFPAAGHSNKFIAFIEKELQPFIEKKYKTNSSKTIIGQSLGGLLATEILLKKSNLFNKYIIISPSLWWDNGSLLNPASVIKPDSFSQNTGIYIGVGLEGPSPGDTPHVMEKDAKLLAEKIKSIKSKNVHVYFDYLPQEDHATISHQAVFNAFRLLCPVTAADQIVKSSVTNKDGVRLDMVYNNTQRTAIFVFKGENIEMKQDTTASGIKYSNSHYEFTEWHGEITLKRDGKEIFIHK